MSKKDYILISTVIRNSGATKKAKGQMVDDFAHALYMDNPRFDLARFRIACNAKPEVVR